MCFHIFSHLGFVTIPFFFFMYEFSRSSLIPLACKEFSSHRFGFQSLRRFLWISNHDGLPLGWGLVGKMFSPVEPPVTLSALYLSHDISFYADIIFPTRLAGWHLLVVVYLSLASLHNIILDKLIQYQFCICHSSRDYRIATAFGGLATPPGT